MLMNVPASIVHALQNARSIAIAAHIRPDGDALGSTLALGLALRSQGKDVTLWNEDEVPETLRFLPGAELIQQSSSGMPMLDPEVAVILDTSNRERIGPNTLAMLAGAGQCINIDHHPSNPGFGHLVWINSQAAAVGEMVHDLIQAAGWPVTPEIRDNLFVAISSDTGGLRYANTSAHTLRVMAALTGAGANVGELSQQIFGCYPLRRVTLLRELLPLLRMSAEGQIASCAITLDMKERLGIHGSDAEGLIDIIRGIDTVVAAVIFEENSAEIRVSVRSKDMRCDVRRVCEKFGGGGHQAAAGARLPGPLRLAEEQFLRALQNEITGTGN